MSTMQVAHRYFDAWNRRDAYAIAAAFAEGGTYSDPSAGKIFRAMPLPLTPRACGLRFAIFRSRS